MALHALLASACGSGEPIALDPDGGADALHSLESNGGQVTPTAPAAPEPPKPVAMECPDGWAIVPEEPGGVSCAPFAVAPGDCPPEASWLPGRTACAPVGAPCPSAPFPDDLPPGDYVFVLPGATDGDGTRTRPYGDLSRALSEAGASATVVAGQGTHELPITLGNGARLLGACAAGTILRAPTDVTDPAVRVTGQDGALRDLRVVAGGGAGIAFDVGAALRLEGVVVEAGGGAGVVLDGAEVDARGLIIRGTDAGNGIGLDVRGASTVSIRGLDIQGAAGEGVHVVDGSVLELAEARVRETRAHQDGTSGVGILAQGGSRIVLREVVVDGNHRAGVELLDAGTTARLVDLVVRDTLSEPAGLGGRAQGYGLLVDMEAVATLENGLFERNRRTGVRVDGRATLEATQLVVRDTLPQEWDQRHGMGLLVNGDATVEVHGGLFQRNQRTGVRADRARLILEDTVISDTTAPPGAGEGGWGLHLDGALAEVRRIALERNTEAGIFAARPEADLLLEDVTVRGTRPREGAAVGGRGFYASFSPTVRMNRALFEDNQENAVGIFGIGTTALLEDVRIRRTESRATDARFGTGLTVSGATVEGTRIDIEESRQMGVWVGTQGSVRLSDLRVRDVHVERCAALGLCEGLTGNGLGVYQLASLYVERFSVDHASVCGVQLAAGGSLCLRGGVVSGSVVGACVQTEGYDLGKLTEQVRYEQNQRNVDATEFPVPEVVDTLQSGS